MKQLLEYRRNLVKRLVDAAEEFRAACLAVSKPYEPIEPGGWSVHQVAVHTRDTDQLVYGERARLTLTEDNPEFPNFDGDAQMALYYDASEPLRPLLAGFVVGVHSLAMLLEHLPPKGWSRESSHETQGGGLTVQTWVERDLQHIEEHLATVKKAAGSA